MMESIGKCVVCVVFIVINYCIIVITVRPDGPVRPLQVRALSLMELVSDGANNELNDNNTSKIKLGSGTSSADDPQKVSVG